jgi:hypothetical protein
METFLGIYIHLRYIVIYTKQYNCNHYICYESGCSYNTLYLNITQTLKPTNKETNEQTLTQTNTQMTKSTNHQQSQDTKSNNKTENTHNIK